jgi:hypothetical protein
MLLDLTKLHGARDHVERTLQPSLFEPDEEYRIVALVRLTMDVMRRAATPSGRRHVGAPELRRCLEPRDADRVGLRPALRPCRAERREGERETATRI